jgi:hypothetical protein
MAEIISHEPQTVAFLEHPLSLALLDSSDYNASRARLNKYGEVEDWSNIGRYVCWSSIKQP